MYESQGLKNTHITFVVAYYIVTFIPKLVMIMITGILKMDVQNVKKHHQIFESIWIIILSLIQFDYLWEKLFTSEK